jgi:hypothetical protein
MPFLFFRKTNLNLSPVIRDINVVPQGRRLAWDLPDITTYGSKLILERKPTAIPTWRPIRDFDLIAKPSPDSIARVATDKFTVYYQDSATIEFIDYDYRLTYVTKTGDKHYSNIVTVIPFDNGNRGTLSQVNFKASKTDASTIAELSVGWDYNTPYPATLKEFKIYVKDPAQGDVYYLHRTIAATSFGNPSYGVKSGNTYKTTTKVNNSSGANFTGSSLSIKIVAMHSDGGSAVAFSGGGGIEVRDK